MGEEEEDQDTVKEMLGRCSAAFGVRAFPCDADRASIVPPADLLLTHPTGTAALRDCKEVL